MSTRDGGPAFPVVGDMRLDGTYPGAPGMSLRDWFAGQALNGMAANPDNGGAPADTAFVAYALADAMLAERTRK